MRIAVFSDIHGNLEALRAVLSDAGLRKVDRYVCLGDVVGYGPNPNECISLLRDLPNLYAILGNHEAALLDIPDNMSGDALRVIRWTRSVLTKSSWWFLRELEDILHWEKIAFCHSNPYRPRRWHYISERTSINSSFSRSKAKIIFAGHTHIPIAITRKNMFCVYIRSPEHHMTVPAAQLNRQIFNCGSVGQPRDGDPRAAYLIYDTTRELVSFYRVGYEVESVATRIVSLGLPELLAKRLLRGV